MPPLLTTDCKTHHQASTQISVSPRAVGLKRKKITKWLVIHFKDESYLFGLKPKIFTNMSNLVKHMLVRVCPLYKLTLDLYNFFSNRLDSSRVYQTESGSQSRVFLARTCVLKKLEIYLRFKFEKYIHLCKKKKNSKSKERRHIEEKIKPSWTPETR